MKKKVMQATLKYPRKLQIKKSLCNLSANQKTEIELFIWDEI